MSNWFLRQLLANNDFILDAFDENSHPRDETGRFTTKTSLNNTRLAWQNFPNVFIAQTHRQITDNPHYQKAKQGDTESALLLVGQIISNEHILKLTEFLKNFDDVIILPVHAEEKSGRNKIPMAFAKLLQEVLELELDNNIIQISTGNRTTSNGVERLLKRVLFDGKVQKGRNYFIVDDVITQGGTLADLRGYIESLGGNVIGAGALSGKAHSSVLAITKPTLGLLRQQAGKDIEKYWQQHFGYGYEAFTESEARYLNKQIHRYGIDTIAKTILATRLKRSD